jgi:organic radical activating enzyme
VLRAAEDDYDNGGPLARWCDTDFVGVEMLTGPELVSRVDALWPRPAGRRPARWVVLTGGEPALQLDPLLMSEFHRAQIEVAVETNGSVECPALAEADWLTVSPKRNLGLWAQCPRPDELKVVLPGAVDGEEGWPEETLLSLANAFRMGERRNVLRTRLFVQPQDEIDPRFVNVSHLARPRGHAMPITYAVDIEDAYKRNLAACIAFVQAHPEWALSVQTHKYIHLR